MAEFMNEKELIKELEKYKQNDKKDNKADIFISFLKKNGRDSFFRTSKDGHITASGWLISEDLKKVLLISHKKLKKIIQPGGHCESNDSSVKMAALRELQEETGLKDIMSVSDEIFYIDIYEIASGDKMHIHYDVCYLFTCNDKQQIRISNESDNIKWYYLDDIEYMDSMDAAVLKMTEKTKSINIYK